MKHLAVCCVMVALVTGISLLPAPAKAGIVIDIDTVTPGTQLTLPLAPGSTIITVPIFFDPAFGGPTLAPVDSVGLDLSWGTTGSASATPMTPMLAGTVVGGTPAVDMMTGTPVAPGTPLTVAGAPGVPPFLMGASHDDTATSYGIGPWMVPLNLMGATFMVSGALGDTITFTPSGILMPGVLTGPPGGPVPPFVFGGAALQGSTAVGLTIPQTFTSATVMFVPEPSSITLLALLLGGLHVLKRRRG